LSIGFLRLIGASRVFEGEERSATVVTQEGAKDRLETLYRRFGPVVYSRCRRILRDDALAEDAAHEVFMRVHRHLAEMPDDRASLAWIYRISTNYCLNLLRSRATQAEPVAELPHRAGADPEAAYADRDAVLRLISQAPRKLQAPALLYYFDGLEQAEVARVLGVSLRTVTNRLAAFAERSRRFMARSGGLS
jgi:RNA polymerase sigma-70 factor, ECF subfamily